MAETILSVGIDVGTSTTQVLFSRLTLENLAGPASVPRIQIVDKQVVFRSPIHETPLLSPDSIDAETLKRIVLGEYDRAEVRPDEVRTGAAIITGETARADNAAQVLAALSELAGDFVVATAGPHLESVLAARGAGIDLFSQHTSRTVANLDIGGGTTNIACYQRGRLVGATCLDIGGRLVRVRDGRVRYISTAMQRLAAASGIPLRVGDPVDIDRLRTLTRVMARQLAMAIHLVDADECHAGLYTNDGFPLPGAVVPGIVSFSGGVADLIDAPADTEPFRYDDIGVLLGRAISDDSAFRLVGRHQAAETIGATVVGAGVHTTEVSGSTIEFAAAQLPVRNVPTIRIREDHEGDPRAMAAEIGDGLHLLHPGQTDQTVAVCLSGAHASSFGEVRNTAEAIIEGARPVLEGPNPLVIVVELDRAKVLGQTLAALRGRRDDVICIDGVQTTDGDYIDIGTPIGAGRVVPVVVKTLVFND
jgi:ethanolamine utilization protein EutA